MKKKKQKPKVENVQITEQDLEYFASQITEQDMDYFASMYQECVDDEIAIEIDEDLE